MYMSLSHLLEIVKDRETWYAAVRGVAKSVWKHDLGNEQWQQQGKVKKSKIYVIGEQINE